MEYEDVAARRDMAIRCFEPVRPMCELAIQSDICEETKFLSTSLALASPATSGYAELEMALSFLGAPKNDLKSFFNSNKQLAESIKDALSFYLKAAFFKFILIYFYNKNKYV